LRVWGGIIEKLLGVQPSVWALPSLPWRLRRGVTIHTSDNRFERRSAAAQGDEPFPRAFLVDLVPRGRTPCRPKIGLELDLQLPIWRGGSMIYFFF
jgi:hypothetical protein